MIQTFSCCRMKYIMLSALSVVVNEFSLVNISVACNIRGPMSTAAIVQIMLACCADNNSDTNKPQLTQCHRIYRFDGLRP